MPERDGLPWSVDEYVVVGDLWVRRGRSVGIRDQEVIELASLLGRSPAAVSRRVGNFQGTDEPGRGLKPITGEPLAVWLELRGDRARLAAAVREAKVRLGLVTVGSAAQPSTGALVRLVPPERPSVEPVEVATTAEVRTAQQTEAGLRETFRQWRDPSGVRLRGIEIETPTGTLRVDLYDELISVLIEAKANASRNSLRFAIGQLYDYRRYLDFAVELAVLTPERPSDDLLALLASAGVGAIWPVGRGFTDSTDGRILRTPQ